MITKEKFSLVVEDSILIPIVRQDNAFKEVDTKALIFKFYWINFILPISDMYCFNKLKKHICSEEVHSEFVKIVLYFYQWKLLQI